MRILGINTPESVDPRRPAQAYGEEAAAYTRRLLEGQDVLLVPGKTPRDRYGRLLAWVWLLDGTFVNALLVRDGYAQVYTFGDNPDHAGLLLVCQREAQAANRGLWALPETEAAGVDQARAAGEAIASAGVAITREPGAVSRGGVATVASPGATCTITVTYMSGPSRATGLEPQQADDSGAVTWSWRVGLNTSSGTWPVRIRCGTAEAETSVIVR